MAQVCFSDFILKSRFREMTSGFISHIVLQYLQKLFFFFTQTLNLFSKNQQHQIICMDGIKLTFISRSIGLVRMAPWKEIITLVVTNRKTAD